MKNVLERFEEVRDELFDACNYDGVDYGVEIYENSTWYYNSEESVAWVGEDKEVYSEEVSSVHVGDEYTLFTLRLSTGGEGINIFKNENETNEEIEY